MLFCSQEAKSFFESNDFHLHDQNKGSQNKGAHLDTPLSSAKKRSSAAITRQPIHRISPFSSLAALNAPIQCLVFNNQ
jgi:hypothetical protein